MRKGGSSPRTGRHSRTSPRGFRGAPRRIARRLTIEPLEERLSLSAEAAIDYLLSHPATVAWESSPWLTDDELAPMPSELPDGVLGATPGVSSPNLVYTPPVYTTLANGMPSLHSRLGAPATIFLDFDGDATTSTDPYDEDGTPATFNTTEANNIAEAWRQMSLYYALFDVDVTTIQPNVSTTRTAWEAVGNNISGGYSYVGVFPNTYPRSFNQSSDARGRVSGIAHEIGHNFGNGHQAEFDWLGNLTREYALATDTLHGPLMGVDYDGFVHKWTWGHPSSSPTNLQDDMAVIANKIKAAPGYTGDGYAPDGHGGTIAAATALSTSGVAQYATGIIERLTDIDAFSFASSGGRYSIFVTRDAPSGVDTTLSIYDGGGVLLASQDGDPAAVPLTDVYDSAISIDLPAGTYYALVGSHGNYSDQGQYKILVTPLPSGWSAREVGFVGKNVGPGYVSYDAAASTFTVVASGSDIWGSSDSLVYAYQTLQGDGTIIARVASMDNTAAWAKAGVMIRESLANNSKDVAIIMSPQNGPQMLWRSSTGGSTSSSNGTAAAFTPTWVRLVRSGNTFTGYTSSNGTTWTQRSQVTVSMNATVYIGLATCSLDQSNVNVATFTDVTVTGNLNPGPTLNALAAPASLAVTGVAASSVALSWSDVPGSTGFKIERSSDGVEFVQAGTVAAGVTTYSDTGLSGYQRYFYRVRATDAAGVSVPSAVVNATTRADAVRNFKITSWNTTQLILNWTEASGETGYRIERSADGVTGWTTVTTLNTKNIPSYTQSGLTAATTYYYRVVTLDATGDAATSAVVAASTRLAAVTGTAFTNKAANQMAISWSATTGATGYRIERSTDGTTFSTLTTVGSVTSYADNSVSPLGEYYYRVVALNALSESVSGTATIFAATPAAAALPSPWLSADIGSVAGTGAAGYSGGVYTAIGAGSDISGTADQFRYIYQPLNGDGSLTLRVASQENTAAGAKAGVMIRETLNANARNAFCLVTPTNGTAFQYRTTAGGSTTSVAGPSSAAPYWLRITRSGNTFTAAVSADNVTWTTIGSQTITMGSSVFIGMAADANTSTTLNRATFDNLASSINTPPTIASPATATLNADNKTVALAVLGADNDGEPGLTYTWAATTIPSGATAPTFTVNGTNAAKNATATLFKAGAYTFSVTIADAFNATVVGTVDITVNQVATGIAVSPATANVLAGATQQFTAAATDQFGAAMPTQPTFTWSTTVGTISSGGLLTAPSRGGTGSVTATAGAASGTAAVQVFQRVVTSTPVDTTVRKDNPDTSYAQATSIKVDGDTTNSLGLPAHGLLRFNNLFGTGVNQIPPGATIVSATLQVRVTNNGDPLEFHRMAQAWQDTATWNSMVNGIQADGVEAIAAADLTTSAVGTGTRTFTLTTSVQIWSDNPAGNFGWAILPVLGKTDGVDFDSAEGTTSPATPPKLTVDYIPRPSVAGRYVFYNASAFDGGNPAATAADDAAIASDKQALLPGGTATFANYTNYTRGINGVMVDLAYAANATAVTAADFAFAVGNDDTPSGWTAAPAPASVTVRSGAGTGGSDRVTIVWADNAIQNKWLQVKVLATSRTGLAADDVFYFGNAVGETGNDATNTLRLVDSQDEAAVRSNKTGFAPAAITNAYDFNRDRRVSAGDELTARYQATTPATSLKLIAPATAAAALMASAEPAAADTGATGVSPVLAESPSGTAVPGEILAEAPSRPTRLRHTSSVSSFAAAHDAVLTAATTSADGPTLWTPEWFWWYDDGQVGSAKSPAKRLRTLEPAADRQ
jgi:regulation of enolase protein 1 (concanavalin A-like superfamily)